MLVDRELRFHRRVSQVRQYQVSAETLVIKPHGLGAIAVEQKKRRTTQYCLTSHQCPVVPNNVYIYVSGTANVRPGDESQGLSGWRPRRSELIAVPARSDQGAVGETEH